MTGYTDKQLQDARVYAAETSWACAEACFDSDYGFASHVTYADKLEYRQRRVDNAMSILSGKCDGNFTVAQRMQTFLTGECVPFLSN